MKKFDDYEGFEGSKFTGKRKTSHMKSEEIQKSKPKSKKPWTKNHERPVILDEEESA